MEDRRARRNLIAERDKKLISYRKRLNELWRMKRELPLVPLDKPVQRGFKKEFVLRDDIARRSDAHDLRRILGEINMTVYCKDETFRTKKWHNKQSEDIPHRLKAISPHRWNALDWPKHYATKWFYFSPSIVVYGYAGTSYTIKGWRFYYDYMFTSKISPNFATHSKQVCPEIEREISEIKQYFTQHNGWARLNHLQGHSNPYWSVEPKEKMIDEILREEMTNYEDNYLDDPDLLE